jgi:hypothetical protein
MMPNTYRYQATFRHNKTNHEVVKSTTAYNVMDAAMQCALLMGSTADYTLVEIGPHPDEISSVRGLIDALGKSMRTSVSDVPSTSTQGGIQGGVLPPGAVIK